MFNDVFSTTTETTTPTTPEQQLQQQHITTKPIMAMGENNKSNGKDIEILLIEKLAKGEISSEVYADAIVRLKKKQVKDMSVDLGYHQ